MELQQQLKMGSFISKRTGKAFEWNVNDCNTFFIEMHDYVYGTTDYEDKVKGAYSHKEGAKEFMRNLKITPAMWLHLRDYKELKAKNPQWENGDVVTIERGYYASVYVYFEGAFWTVPEGQEIKGYHPKAFKKLEKRNWRK
jgi:hypothetical protein